MAEFELMDLFASKERPDYKPILTKVNTDIQNAGSEMDWETMFRSMNLWRKIVLVGNML